MVVSQGDETKGSEDNSQEDVSLQNNTNQATVVPLTPQLPPKHGISRDTPWAPLDNLRTTLIFLLIFQNVVLETVSNSLNNIEETSPIQYLFLSIFTGLFRNFAVGLLFSVSGFSTYLSICVHHKSRVDHFLFRRQFRSCIYFLFAFLIMKLVEYVYGEPRPGVKTGPETSTSLEESLTLGPITYLGFLPIFDSFYCIYFIYIASNPQRFEKMFKDPFKSQTRYRAIAVVTAVLLATWSILASAGFMTFDTHALMQYIVGYATGVLFFSLAPYYLPSPLPRYAIHTIILRLIFLPTSFAGLYLYYPDMKAQLQQADPKMIGRIDSEESPLVDFGGPAIVYGAWCTLVYFTMAHSFHHLFFSPLSNGSGLRWFRRKWGLVARYSKAQVFIHTFFTICFARHTGWIDNLIWRCVLVWAATIVSGYTTVALLEVITWRITRLLVKDADALRRRGLVQFCFDHLWLLIDERNLQRYEDLLLLGKGVSDCVELETGKDGDGDEAQKLMGLATWTEKTGVKDDEDSDTCIPQADHVDDEEVNAVSTKVATKQFKHSTGFGPCTVDNLRTTLSVLLILRYAIIETVINSPDHPEENFPIQSGILSVFLTLNRTVVVGMLYLLAGVWSAQTMRLEKMSRLRCGGMKVLKAFLFVAGYCVTSRLTYYAYYSKPYATNAQLGASPQGSLTNGEVAMSQGPIFYVLLLLILDLCYSATLKTQPSSKSAGTSSKGLRRFNLISLGCAFASRLPIVAVFATSFFRTGDMSYFLLDPHLLGIYIMAYFAGIHYTSICSYLYLSANVLGNTSILTLCVRAVPLCPPLVLIHILAPPLLLNPARSFPQHELPHLKWFTFAMQVMTLPTIFFALASSILLVFVQVPALKKDWGVVSRVWYIQPFIQMFIVIWLARNTYWIDNLLARCSFVGAGALVCGWAVAVPIFVLWQRAMDAMGRGDRSMWPLSKASPV